LTLAPLASGEASVTVPAESEELKPPPAACAGGCSSVVPCTAQTLDGQAGFAPAIWTATGAEVRGRRSAKPAGAG
jgi:hypothetical protein